MTSLSSGFSSKLRSNCPYILLLHRLSFIFSPVLSFVFFVYFSLPLGFWLSVALFSMYWSVRSVSLYQCRFFTVHTFNQFRKVRSLGFFWLHQLPSFLCLGNTSDLCLCVMLSMDGKQFIGLPVQFSHFFFFQLIIPKRYLNLLYSDDGSSRFLWNVGAYRVPQWYVPQGRSSDILIAAMTCLGHILMALTKSVPWRLTCAAPGDWLRRVFPVVPYPSASPSCCMKLYCSASASCWINFCLSFNCARHCKFRLVVMPLSLIRQASIFSFHI